MATLYPVSIVSNYTSLSVLIPPEHVLILQVRVRHQPTADRVRPQPLLVPRRPPALPRRPRQPLRHAGRPRGAKRDPRLRAGRRPDIQGGSAGSKPEIQLIQAMVIPTQLAHYKNKLYEFVKNCTF